MAAEYADATPGWMVGLLIVFALATAVTFGLFLYRHAEDNALTARYRDLKDRARDLETEHREIVKVRPNLDNLITLRQTALASNAELDKQTQLDVERLVTQNVQTEKGFEAVLEKDKATYKAKLEEAKARRNELKAEEERYLTAERTHDEARLKRRDEVEALSREVERVRREDRGESTVRVARIDELADRIRELTQQREQNNRELRSDGQLIAARATDGYVVVDRGQQHNLRKGTRFAVFNIRGGRKLIKGAVEIVDVQARMATARVIEEKDANDPLVPGDHIHNPIYNPEDRKVFVIKGDFTTFSQEEIARFIERSGGRVDAELSVETDYLVAGGRADAALAQASRLGVSVLSEGQAIEMVRWEPRFSVRKGMVFVMKGRFNQVNESAIRGFITASGGVIEGDLRNGTTVLVVGTDAEDHIAKARTLGVTVVDQSQFRHLAGAEPTTKGNQQK